MSRSSGVRARSRWCGRSQSIGGWRRCALRVPRCFLASIRRSRAARDGRVARRGGDGGSRASRSRAVSRARAASRLRSCDRCSDEVSVTTPSTTRWARRSRARARCTSVSTAEFATSQLSSTRLSLVFTPCPPGPEERLNRSCSSSAGIRSPRGMPRAGGRTRSSTRYGVAGVDCTSRIQASTSAASRGSPAERLRAAPSVTTMSSSMRTPMPRSSAGTVRSLVWK